MYKRLFWVCALTVLTFSSCKLITELFGLTEESNTRVEKITHTFTISDTLVYIHINSETQNESTFVINTDKETLDIISRIHYGNNNGEYRAIQVTAYKNRLWLLGSAMSKKILIFDPETGITEKEITFSENNVHRMNFLPNMGKLAVMHGNSYGLGFCVSLIDLETETYDRTVYVQALAPVLKENGNTIYGSGNDMPSSNPNQGFGIYTFSDNNLELETLFPLKPATDSVDMCLVDVNKFLILEDGTFVVCDYTIGLKIKYPDGSVGELARDNIPFNPDIGNYKNVDNIYYSQKYDRIYVEMYGENLYKFAEKDSVGKWKWNETTKLYPSSESVNSSTATKINGDILVETYENADDTIFIVRFYDIEKFDLLKEVRWDLQTDKKEQTTY